MADLQQEQKPNSKLIICPFCHHQNKPDADICYKCEAPIGFDVNQTSIEKIQAENTYVSKAVSTQPKLLFVIGVWIVFLPVLIILLIFLRWQLSYFYRSFFGLLRFNVNAFLALLIASWLYRMTKNYFQKGKSIDDQI